MTIAPHKLVLTRQQAIECMTRHQAVRAAREKGLTSIQQGNQTIELWFPLVTLEFRVADVFGGDSQTYDGTNRDGARVEGNVEEVEAGGWFSASSVQKTVRVEAIVTLVSKGNGTKIEELMQLNIGDLVRMKGYMRYSDYESYPRKLNSLPGGPAIQLYKSTLS